MSNNILSLKVIEKPDSLQLMEGMTNYLLDNAIAGTDAGKPQALVPDDRMDLGVLSIRVSKDLRFFVNHIKWKSMYFDLNNLSYRYYSNARSIITEDGDKCFIANDPRISNPAVSVLDDHCSGIIEQIDFDPAKFYSIFEMKFSKSFNCLVTAGVASLKPIEDPADYLDPETEGYLYCWSHHGSTFKEVYCRRFPYLTGLYLSGRYPVAVLGGNIDNGIYVVDIEKGDTLQKIRVKNDHINLIRSIAGGGDYFSLNTTNGSSYVYKITKSFNKISCKIVKYLIDQTVLTFGEDEAYCYTVDRQGTLNKLQTGSFEAVSHFSGQFQRMAAADMTKDGKFLISAPLDSHDNSHNYIDIFSMAEDRSIARIFPIDEKVFYIFTDSNYYYTNKPPNATKDNCSSFLEKINEIVYNDRQKVLERIFGG